MLAKVIAPTTVHNEPRQVGDVLEVDEITFANLAAKGRLEQVKEDATKTAKPAKADK